MVASCACKRLTRNGEAARAAPALTVVSSRRREIDPLVIFLAMMSSPGYYIWLLLRRPRSNSSQRRQDKLRRQRNLGNDRAERLQRVSQRIVFRAGRTRLTGLARAQSTQFRL